MDKTETTPPKAQSHPQARGLHALAYLLLLGWCWPLLRDPQAYGYLDWDWFISYFHVVRLSLLDYGQFPGFNPFVYMGAPLWANPQVSPTSYLTPFVLLFGPIYGLKIGVTAGYLLAFEGGRMLGRALFQRPSVAVIAGLLYALNGALTAHLVMGHLSNAGYALAPWLVLWCLRLKEHRWSGLFAGLFAGLMVQIGIGYFTVQALTLCALLALWVWAREQGWRRWRPLARFGGLFLLAFLAVSSTRLLPILYVMHDFPRTLHAALPGLSLSQLGRMFFVPELTLDIWWRAKAGGALQLIALEYWAYAGFLACGLAAISLRWGVRWYHVGALLSGALMLGSSQPWMPSYWLSQIRPFDSMWVVYRWRLVLLGCLAFAAAHGLDKLLDAAQETSPTRQKLLLALGLLAPLEIMVALYPAWYKKIAPFYYPHLTRKQLRLPDPPHLLSFPRFWQVRGRTPVYYPLFRAGLGAVGGYEPLYGYTLQENVRLHPWFPGYKGEYTINNRPITPLSWSPNRIRFTDLPPGASLLLNVVPGKGWSLNGMPLFTKMKLFELGEEFRVTVPKSGKVDLRYRPPGLIAGIWLSLLSLFILLLWWYKERRTSEPPNNEQNRVIQHYSL